MSYDGDSGIADTAEIIQFAIVHLKGKTLSGVYRLSVMKQCCVVLDDS